MIKMIFFSIIIASVQSPSYADTPQAQAANQPLSMDPILCKNNICFYFLVIKNVSIDIKLVFSIF